MAPPRRLPELIDGATEEILLRIAPEEPAHLVRASLVCKLWRRLLVDPAFVRRYREFHRTPPMLGFFQNQLAAADRVHAPWFVPTTSAPPLPQLAFEYSTGWEVLSSCHGRVLVGHGSIGMNLVVWDPVTRLRQRLPMPRMRLCFNYSYAVLCAVGSCNHLDCHGGPFLVVSVGSCPVCSSLHLWSRKLDPKGSAGWVQCRVIDLEKLFPINNPRSQPRVIGFAEGLGVIFLWTDVGVFMMELKSGRKRKERN
uniref:F-box domain-containing protein n=1 Tax=Setaria italica TaxID=4555 RepID=K4A005_SETIT